MTPPPATIHSATLKRDATGASQDLPGVTAVIVAYGPEEWLELSVRAVLASTGVDAEVVLIDNGGTGGEAARLGGIHGVRLIDPEGNVGFATGCNLGAAASTREFIALINPDAVVATDALAELVAVAVDPAVGLASGSIRLANDPERLNSAGNVIHFLGLSWSGCFNEPARDHAHQREVTSASGAGFACRREVWESLGGFCDEFFAYCEDADLSLRSWQRGWKVIYVPTAIVTHRYHFSRNALKYQLLERNRLIMTASCFGARHLLLVAPLLFGLEIGMLALAAKQGWLRQKLVGYWWLLRHLTWLAARRRLVQGARTVDERALTHLYSPQLDPANLELPVAVEPANQLLSRYWLLVRRLT